jgi:hypothetical protein
MSAPDFGDIEYEPEESDRSTAHDAESFVEFCCRLPLTTCATIGVLVIGIGYLIIIPNPFLRLLGIVVVLAIAGGFNYRY